MARTTDHVKHAHSCLAKAINHLENLMKDKKKLKKESKVKDVKKADGKKLPMAKKAKKK